MGICLASGVLPRREGRLKDNYVQPELNIPMHKAFGHTRKHTDKDKAVSSGQEIAGLAVPPMPDQGLVRYAQWDHARLVMIKPCAQYNHTHTHTYAHLQCYSLSWSQPPPRAGSPAVKVHVSLLLENEALQPKTVILVGAAVDPSQLHAHRHAQVQKETGWTQTTGLSVLANVGLRNLSWIKKLLVLQHQKYGFLLPQQVFADRRVGWRSCSSSKACSSPGLSPAQLVQPTCPSRGQFPWAIKLMIINGQVLWPCSGPPSLQIFLPLRLCLPLVPATLVQPRCLTLLMLPPHRYRSGGTPTPGPGLWYRTQPASCSDAVVAGKERTLCCYTEKSVLIQLPNVNWFSIDSSKPWGCACSQYRCHLTLTVIDPHPKESHF